MNASTPISPREPAPPSKANIGREIDRPAIGQAAVVLIELEIDEVGKGGAERFQRPRFLDIHVEGIEVQEASSDTISCNSANACSTVLIRFNSVAVDDFQRQPDAEVPGLGGENGERESGGPVLEIRLDWPGRLPCRASRP